MSLLSITFHTSTAIQNSWNLYTENELIMLIDNLMDVDHYVLSKVDSDLIEEGNNTNLLLFFANQTLREEFLENEMKNIAERILTKFKEEVLIFKTFLNPVKIRLQ